MQVTLDNADYKQAVEVAAAQMARKYQYGRTNDHGEGDSGRGYETRMQNTIDGLLAEIAVAKAFGQSWSPGGVKVSTGDVGKIEVRHTKYPQGNLLLYRTDSEEAIYILVVGVYPTLRLAGWIQGFEGKQPAMWKNSVTPCYWIPQAALKPIPRTA